MAHQNSWTPVKLEDKLLPNSHFGVNFFQKILSDIKFVVGKVFDVVWTVATIRTVVWELTGKSVVVVATVVLVALD